MSCDWPVIYTQCEDNGSCLHLEGMDELTAEAVVESATEWLWNATNRRFGNCTSTLLPCLKGCRHGGRPQPFRLAPGSLSWINVGCAACGNMCSCSNISAVTLPTFGTVTEVRLDGVVFDDWQLLNGKYLLRIDGGQWPTCQELGVTPPTWEVDFVPGNPVPQMGQIAAGLLACQMARRFCGQACDLPANTTNVTRQGVTIAIDPMTETGIYLIDHWIKRMNVAPARVWSPDVPVLPVLPEPVTSS